MPRSTVESILKQLVEQQYIPRVVVYSNSNYGRIEAVIYNVQGDNNRNYCGEPSAKFEAFRRGNTNCVPFQTLAAALLYIGVNSMS